jgi:DNA-binding NtrC family response regulator
MILVVDDDASVTASLGLLLRQAGYAVLTAAGPAEALAVAEAPSLVLQDMNFSRHTSGEEGLALLRELKGRWPAVPVVLMTAWGSIPLAVEGMRAGASDFVTKPWTNAQLLQSVRTVLGLTEARTASVGATPSREELDERCDLGSLVGEDPRFLAVLEVVARVAPTDASVLITGESGTGKELVAEAVHRNSRRQAGPFVKVNLGGIATSIFESEMFGHVRGAFTDARADRVGRFELADGGTLFLDEIGNVPASQQAKLLRVLETGEFERVGSSRTLRSDARLISASNADLNAEVAAGRFRQDLLFRLNTIEIRVPPLRERRDDIPLLARNFLAAHAQRYHKSLAGFEAEALEGLLAHPWPGNVRELDHAVERAVLMATGERIRVGDLGLRRAGDAPRLEDLSLEEVEGLLVRKAMDRFGGNVSQAARALGLSRSALYRRLEKYGQ